MVPRPGPQPDDLIRRLRAWPVSSWQYGHREAVAREAAQRLAGAAAAVAGEPPRTVPDAGVHALPDQLAVLAADAERVGVSSSEVAAVFDDLASDLGLG